MQLEYLRSFLEVYRTGTMTGAAKKLHLTQPAISSHIKALEASIDKPLFLRMRRGLEATPVANELAHSISAQIDSLETTLGYIKTRSSNIEGTIYLAAPGEFAQHALSEIIAGLLPLNIRLRLRTGYRDCIIEDLENGEVDLAFLDAPYKPDQFNHVVLTENRLIPVASPEWANIHFDTCHTLEDLINKPLLAYDQDFALVQHYFQNTIGKSCTQSPLVTVHDLRIILEFLYRGHGYTILPKYICKTSLQERKLVRLVDHPKAPTIQTYLVSPKNKLRNPRVFFVKNYIQRAFKHTPCITPS
jgi:DNA-binding transcriptional LysR family regulator